jgi:magnesium transporter
MNFDSSASPWNLPELKLYFGYPLALASMVGVALLMVWYFRRRK